jgi:hypothetical protein
MGTTTLGTNDPRYRRGIVPGAPYRQRVIVESLQAKQALRPGLEATRATDVLWTLNHPDVWLLLVGERGWTPSNGSSGSPTPPAPSCSGAPRPTMPNRRLPPSGWRRGCGPGTAARTSSPRYGRARCTRLVRGPARGTR